MVKIDPSGISRRLKKEKTEKLIKNIFNDSSKHTDSLEGTIQITSSMLGQISVKKIGFPDNFFLIIDLNKNEFHLGDRKYFDKTKELAEKYETYFGGETVIKIRYFKE